MLTEAKISKGGTNPPLEPGAPRPAPPQGSRRGEAFAAAITVLPIGTPLKLCDHEATITAICIRDKLSVQYEVAYWNDGNRRLEWVNDYEIKERSEAARCRIGFSAPG